MSEETKTGLTKLQSEMLGYIKRKGIVNHSMLLLAFGDNYRKTLTRLQFLRLVKRLIDAEGKILFQINSEISRNE